MEIPLQSTLKIGKVTVGIFGLNVALNRIENSPGLDLEKAVDQVYAEVAARNYIPPAAAADYRQAIAGQIRWLRGESGQADSGLTIRILGPGCVSCNRLRELVIEIMAELKVAADIIQVHDPDEIGRFGVLRTPALVINGELKCQGRLPARASVEEWLRLETER